MSRPEPLSKSNESAVCTSRSRSTSAGSAPSSSQGCSNTYDPAASPACSSPRSGSEAQPVHDLLRSALLPWVSQPPGLENATTASAEDDLVAAWEIAAESAEMVLEAEIPCTVEDSHSEKALPAAPRMKPSLASLIDGPKPFCLVHATAGVPPPPPPLKPPIFGMSFTSAMPCPPSATAALGLKTLVPPPPPKPPVLAVETQLPSDVPPPPEVPALGQKAQRPPVGPPRQQPPVFGVNLASTLPCPPPQSPTLGSKKPLLPPPPPQPPVLGADAQWPSAMPPPPQLPAMGQEAHRAPVPAPPLKPPTFAAQMQPSHETVPPPAQAPILRLADAFPEPVQGQVGVPTVGSADHHRGTCRPCAFVYTKGCGNGAQCTFCHLCKPGEKKRRMKEKREIFRHIKD